MSERKKSANPNPFIRVFIFFCISAIIFTILIILGSSLPFSTNNWKIYKIVAMFISFLFFIALMYISEPKEKDMPKLVEKTPVQKTT